MMVDRVVSRLLLKDRIPTYQQRAAAYRERAVVASVRQGLLEQAEGSVERLMFINPHLA